MVGDLTRIANLVFDRLFEAGAPEVLAGTHRCEAPPVDGGRWPVSVIARPPDKMRDRFERWTRRALRCAGKGHFVTGLRDGVHITIRALEPYRDAAAATDPIVGTWLRAMNRAACATAPIRLAFTGLTLSRSGVLAQLEPVDDAAWALMDRLREELGAEAWFEEGWMKRNIWYATLLHFADQVADQPGLISWVRDHRTVEPVEFVINSIELVRFRHRWTSAKKHDRQQLMQPETWGVVPFASQG